MSDNRVSTGIQGLDEILQGGFLPGSGVLLEGSPGSGKTNLGLQILYNGITQFGEPGLLVSFEEYPEQILRDAANLGMDFRPLIEKGLFRVIQTSPVKLREEVVGAGCITQEEIEDAFSIFQPKRVMIDSVTHFKRITTDEVHLREFLLQFLHFMTGRGATTFLTREVIYSDNAPISFEEYLVDASLRLYNISPGSPGGTRRSIEVRKTRGHGHLSGRHPFDFSSEAGMTIYPHRKPSVQTNDFDPSGALERVNTGVRGLDYLMHGGYVKGSSNLLAGTAGAGKTTFALEYIAAGLRAGETCLLVALNESPRRLEEMLCRMGVDVTTALEEGRLIIHYAVPVELCVEKLYCDIEAILKKSNATRLVLDGVSDFTTSVQDENLLRDYLYTLVKLFENRGVTAVLTSEMEHVTGTLGMTDINYAFVLDSVVYLGFCEIESQMRRVITILKQRGSDHESELRELLLTPDGPRIGTKFTGLSGVTGGVATGQYQATMDEMIQPLTFIKGFAEKLLAGDVSDEKRQMLLNQMVQQSDQMIDYLCGYFGMDRQRLLGDNKED